MEQEGITQKELAARAKVSQPSVSRALSSTRPSGGSATRKLAQFLRAQKSPGLDPVRTALADVWDGSDAHALALASLVQASKTLWPDLGED